MEMARSPRRTWNSSKKRNKNGSFWDTSSDKKKTNKQKRGCVRVCGVLPRLLGRTLFFGGAAQTPLTREEKILNVNRRCPSEGSVYSIWTVKWRFKFARFANGVAKRYLHKTHVEGDEFGAGYGSRRFVGVLRYKIYTQHARAQTSTRELTGGKFSFYV